MNVLILIVSVIFGFALACFIFAWILSESNDIGNSTAEVEDFKTEISFDVCMDPLKLDKTVYDERHIFCQWYYQEIAPDPNEPDPDKLVEPPVKHFELEDITAIYVDG